MNSRDHQNSHTGQNCRKQRNTLQYYHYKSYQHGPIKQLSKQQFLQANCQFVVIGGHYDYSPHQSNPDLTVPWEYIEQVRFCQTGSTEIICPICLSIPNAAQITKCGHIFCFSCVLHFLAVNDDKKCPVCFGPLGADDLKSVVSEIQSSVSVGDHIRLRLMHRNKGSVQVESYGPDGTEITDTGSQHKANLIIVDPMVVLKEVTQKERDELLFRQDENEQSEICFVEQAMSILTQRLEKLHRMASYLPKVSELPKLVSEPTTSDQPTKSYLFYQTYSDFQHVYLNPFCTRILCHEYGDLENCPREIEGKILAIECVSMSEAGRKRFKYLQHLPLSCEFRLIEIEVKDLVSPETYEYFKSQIVAREKERERRLREEQKRDKIIEVQQNRKIYGITPALDISLDSQEQFPSVSEQPCTARQLDTVHAVSGREIDSSMNATAATEPLPGNSEEVQREQQQQQQQEETAEADDEPRQPLSSFEAIQMQEEREALKSGNISSGGGCGPWSKQGHCRTTNGVQSSFAKLLVDAKAKPWTKTAPSNRNQSSQSNQQPSSQGPPNSNANQSENEEEESRAPPCGFTLGDFLESNVMNSRKARKTKKTVAKS